MDKLELSNSFSRHYLEVSKHWLYEVIDETSSEQIQAYDLVDDLVRDSDVLVETAELLAILSNNQHWRSCPGCQWKTYAAISEIFLLLGSDSLSAKPGLFMEKALLAARAEPKGWRRGWALSRMAFLFLLAKRPAESMRLIDEALCFVDGSSRFQDDLMELDMAVFGRVEFELGAVLPAMVSMVAVDALRGDLKTGTGRMIRNALSLLSEDSRSRFPLLARLSAQGCVGQSPRRLIALIVEAMSVYKSQGVRSMELLVEEHCPWLENWQESDWVEERKCPGDLGYFVYDHDGD